MGSRLRDALQLVREAGHITLNYFLKKDLQVDRKGDDSPVTVADRAAEAHIRDWLRNAYPDDAIVGEEHGEASGKSSYKWVIDPIDGTKSFISGVPLYTCLLGIMRDDRPEAGIIHAPAAGEMVFAQRGVGAWHELHGVLYPAVVSQTSALPEATLVITTAGHVFELERSPAAGAALARLDERVRLVRTWGDGYGYLLVATGRADVMIDPVLNLWDVAALVPVIEEAGGRITAWDGGDPIAALEAIATNGPLHEPVLGIMRGS